MRGSIPDNVRIQHILECIEEIKTALDKHTFDKFSTNHVLRIAVVKWLEIIGEAANHISEQTKAQNDQIEWRKMIGMRNIVVHEYFGINYEVIWEIATVYLKDLEIKLKARNSE